MTNMEKEKYEKNTELIICFFFLSSNEKYLRNLEESLKIYDFHLHKNTKTIKKTLMIKQRQILNFISQANYIAIGSMNSIYGHLNKLLSVFLVKNIKFLPLIICAEQRVLRIKMPLSANNKNQFLLFPSIIND